MSREHFWPRWAEDLLPDSAAGYVERHGAFTEKVKPVGLPFRRARQGGVKTKKLRVVCKNCNNEWMSALESQAQPSLTSLMLANSCVLDSEAQLVLSQWITMKVIVGEHNIPDDAVIPPEDRDIFRKERRIPNYVSIWISQCGEHPWQAAFTHHSATMSLPGEPRPDASKKNVKTVSFGIGALFVHVLISGTSNIDLGDFFKFGSRFFRLWKPTSISLKWPLPRPLNSSEATQISSSFDSLISRPNIVWKPG